MSDVYALGRILNTVHAWYILSTEQGSCKNFLKHACTTMRISRPEMSAIENYINQLLHMNVQ